jgi:hypothetical protein
MAKILVASEGSWYSELHSVAYYGETEFESHIRQHLQSIFPEYIAFPFKKDITDASGTTKRPDLAMVRKDYGDWCVIETELETHELQHVIDQTRVFRDGDYNSLEITEYIYSQALAINKKKLNKKRLHKLLQARAPSVLVLVDAYKADWEQELKNLGVQLCIFEVYKNTGGSHAFRIDGEYPTVQEVESHCRYTDALFNTLEVVQRAILRKRLNQEIEISFNGRITRWIVLRDKNKTLLRYLGKTNPVPPGTGYVLFKDAQNKFHIRKN